MTGALLLLAVALVVVPRPGLPTARLRGLLPAGGRPANTRRVPPPAGGSGPLVAVASAGACGFALVAGSVPSSAGHALPVVAGGIAGATAGRVATSAVGRRSRDRLAAMQVDAVATVAAEIRAGQRPDVALAAAAPAALPQALRAVEALSERSGAPIATVLDRLEDDLRSRTRHRQAVSTQLAGARSTAVLLAVLPVLGVALGAAMGAEPISVLFGTTTGQLALLAGVVLDSAGVLWTAKIVTAADGDR